MEVTQEKAVFRPRTAPRCPGSAIRPHPRGAVYSSGQGREEERMSLPQRRGGCRAGFRDGGRGAARNVALRRGFLARWVEALRHGLYSGPPLHRPGGRSSGCSRCFPVRKAGRDLRGCPGETRLRSRVRRGHGRGGRRGFRASAPADRDRPAAGGGRARAASRPAHRCEHGGERRPRAWPGRHAPPRSRAARAFFVVTRRGARDHRQLASAGAASDATRRC